jgi:hypothetical protein
MLSIKLAAIAATLASGIAVALAVAPAPGQSKCELPTKPPSTSTPDGTGGTGPTGTQIGPGGGPGGPPLTVTGGGPPTAPSPPSATSPTGTGTTGTTETSGNGDCPPGPKASAAARAETYGKYCKKESRKAVRGRESPFSLCTSAMARLTLGTLGMGAKTTPAKACKAESRKRLIAHRASPYALCVAAGRKLVGQLRKAIPPLPQQ